MAAIPNLDALVDRLLGNASGAPELLMCRKWLSSNNASLGGMTKFGRHSSWPMDGDHTTASGGEAPATATACDLTTAGALPFTAPTGGRTKFITGISTSINGGNSTYPVSFGNLLLYDRLLHMGGLSPVSGTVTVGGTLLRNTGGEGNRIYVEVTTAMLNTSRTITASYTNQAGTAGRTTQPVTTFAASQEYSYFATASKELPLQAGDTGVRSVQSFTITGSNATGLFNVVIGKPLMGAYSPSGTGLQDSVDSGIGGGGVVPIEDNACLAFHVDRITIVSPSPITLFAQTVEG